MNDLVFIDIVLIGNFFISDSADVSVYTTIEPYKAIFDSKI